MISGTRQQCNLRARGGRDRWKTAAAISARVAPRRAADKGANENRTGPEKKGEETVARKNLAKLLEERKSTESQERGPKSARPPARGAAFVSIGGISSSGGGGGVWPVIVEIAANPDS